MRYVKDRTLEEDLYILLERAREVKAVSIGEILEILSGKGPLLVLLFLSLPFCQPLQIPGFSTPFGIIIAIIGFRSALGKQMWLPKKLLFKNIPARVVKKIADKALYVMKKIKRWMHPRWSILCEGLVARIINGFILAFLGICLALPLPVPLTNLAAGWSIFLLSFGLLESDGLFVLLGYLTSFVTFLFFLLIAFSLRVIF